jgi:hypothetical protein
MDIEEQPIRVDLEDKIRLSEFEELPSGFRLLPHFDRLLHF